MPQREPTIAFSGSYLDVIWEQGVEYTHNRRSRGVGAVGGDTAQPANDHLNRLTLGYIFHWMDAATGGQMEEWQRVCPRCHVLMNESFNDISHLKIATTVGGVRAELLYCGVLGGKWWRNYLHVHSFVESCYVAAGAGTFVIAGQKYDLGPHDLFIARPGQPHEIVSSRGDPLEIYFWAHTVEPAEPRLANRDEESIAKLVQLLTTAAEATTAGVTPVVRAPALGAVLTLMAEEASGRLPGYPRVINELFTKLLIDTARAASPDTVRPEAAAGRARSVAESIVQTAVQYLQDNLAQRLEVRDVAAQVNLSERQLSRIFRQATGTSILTYLTRLRMDRAMQLLLHSELPIKQVAAAVGYPDTHYFTTLFGRYTRTTPAAYRRSGGTQFLKGKPKTTQG
jgi:AraC-like DNA-binding protein/mannose-6-phosphate isomerase-like protein (cupin superfamily)